MRIKFLDAAKSDLTECQNFYRQHGGPALAARMISRIKKSIMALSENPKIAPCFDAGLGIRRLVVAHGAFLVFYRIRDYIEIIHIRRAERHPLSGQELKVVLSQSAK